MYQWYFAVILIPCSLLECISDNLIAAIGSMYPKYIGELRADPRVVANVWIRNGCPSKGAKNIDHVREGASISDEVLVEHLAE